MDEYIEHQKLKELKANNKIGKTGVIVKSSVGTIVRIKSRVNQ
jgi:hypothetical protein